MSVKSKSFPASETNLPRTWSLISKSIRVSVSLFIKTSWSFWSTGELGLYTVSTVPSTDVWICLCAKMSNSLLTDDISAPDIMKCEWRKLGEDIQFYYADTLGLFVYRFDTSSESLMAAAAQIIDHIMHGICQVFWLDISWLTSGDLFAVMLVRILPPVRNVSRPTAFVPLYRMRRTQRKLLPKRLPITLPRCM